MLRYILNDFFSSSRPSSGSPSVASPSSRLLPGDPILALAGEHGVSPERYEILKEKFGFDLPIWQQYLG